MRAALCPPSLRLLVPSRSVCVFPGLTCVDLVANLTATCDQQTIEQYHPLLSDCGASHVAEKPAHADIYLVEQVPSLALQSRAMPGFSAVNSSAMTDSTQTKTQTRQLILVAPDC